MKIYYRSAAIRDALQLYYWRNDLVTRLMSRNKKRIPFLGHLVWFVSKLKSPNSKILIFLEGTQRVGVVRFEIQSKICEVSIIVSPKQRGQGIGEKILKIAIAHMPSNYQIRELHAYIRRGNDASKKIFRRNGFILDVNYVDVDLERMVIDFEKTA